jgi:transcriptional regulator with XRE-family HTH domain
MATSPDRPPTRQEGAEIERRRVEAGISVSGLAEKTGLHKTYIRYIERETRSAQPDTLKLIADALPGCEVKDLLKREQNSERPKVAATAALRQSARCVA